MSANAAIFNPTESTSAATGDGFSVPRLTTTGRLGIAFGTGDKGMMVYDTTLNNLFIWNGSAWESVPASGDSSNTQVIFNDNGELVGDAGFTYDKAQDRVQVGQQIDIWKGLLGDSTSVAVGRSALSLTQAGATGNTAIGNQAGQGITTGGFNIAIGYNALLANPANVTGTNNIAIGQDSMRSINAITNNANIGIGVNSLRGLSTGLTNIGIGANAGRSITSAQSCIAIGSNAQANGAASAVTGSFNIAIGDSSMFSSANITGADNVGIGRDTFRNLSSGSDNTAVGAAALNANTIGTSQTAVGRSALVLATGSNNTAIGSSAGSNITTGTNNICIGVSANASANNINNELVIGSTTSYVGTNGGATTYFTTASALSSGSLPVNCGFIRIYLNGSFVKIAVYGN